MNVIFEEIALHIITYHYQTIKPVQRLNDLAYTYIKKINSIFLTALYNGKCAFCLFKFTSPFKISPRPILKWFIMKMNPPNSFCSSEQLFFLLFVLFCFFYFCFVFILLICFCFCFCFVFFFIHSFRTITQYPITPNLVNAYLKSETRTILKL